MSSETESGDTDEIKIQRPLDIGYEFLPEGVSATDFIHYELIPLEKPKLYRKDELPPHDLLGDNAIIRRELLEEEPIEHSEVWLKIVSKLNPELVSKKKEKSTNVQEYLQCHLVDQPTYPRILPSLIPRGTLEEDAEHETGEQNMENKVRSDKTSKEPPMFNFQALEKLKETINWLKFCQEEEEETMNGVSDN